MEINDYKKHQGMGYGKKAVEKALELIRTFPHDEAELIVLSMSLKMMQQGSYMLHSDLKKQVK